MDDVWSFFHRRSIQTLLRGLRPLIFGKTGWRRVQGLRLLYRLRIEVLLRSSKPNLLVTPMRVRLWVDSEAFPRIEKLLQRARHTIVIQMFIWKDDALGRRIAEVLIGSADRGVTVFISKEAVGDIFEFHRDFLATRDGGDPLWQRFWNHPRIRITHAAHHDHGKVFIIDERIVLLTGMNIASEYHERWHDYLVELRGRRFVEQYLSGDAPPGDAAARIRLVANTERHREIRKVLRELLLSARLSIVIEHAYFSDPEVIDLLARRTHAGIRVTLILSAVSEFHYHRNMQAAAELMAKADSRHLQVLLHPRMIHGKIILVDRRRAFMGSANLITGSLDQMGEVNVLIDGKHRYALRKLREILRHDILLSRLLKESPRSFVGKWLAMLRL